MNPGCDQELDQSVVMEGSCSRAAPVVLDQSTLPPQTRPTWECHICLEFPKTPVATSCGHVFCWPCLSEWLQGARKPCPICRKVLSSHANVLSLHSTGDTGAASSPGNDSASGIPPRPPNPLLFFPRVAGATPDSDASDFLSIRRAIGELLRERSRARRVATEQAHLNQQKTELVRKISELKREAKRVGECIARLQQRLDKANALLPPGWSDDAELAHNRLPASVIEE